MNEYDALEVIDGCLLSDASLVKKKGYVNPYFWIDLSGVEHLDWLCAIKSALLSWDIPVSDKCPKTTPRQRKLRGKALKYVEVALWSACNSKLLTLYQKWYPNGRKVVPADLALTPVTLAHWFMGDGSSWQMSGRQNLVRAKFCTNGLPIDDIDRLAHLLSGFRITAIRYESDRVLFVNDAASITKLMKIVEPYIVPSYRYKVKYPILKSFPRGPKR